MSGGNIIGGVIGATIGFFVGGPMGALKGFAIGSAIGGVIMPGELPTVEGPRLDDLRPQASEYGRPIPIIFGTVAIQGNVIWQPNLIEVVTETEQGGGSMQPSQTTINKTYYTHVAILLCKGVIDGVLRVWAGPEKRLVYDGFTMESGEMRVYNGTTDQMPDPLIQQYLGVENTSAFRGNAYVVIENFNVTENDFSRLPIFTFEVARTTSGIENNYTNVDIGSGQFARLYDYPPLYVNRFVAGAVTLGTAQDPADGHIYYLRRYGATSDEPMVLDKVLLGVGLVDSLPLTDGSWYGKMAFNPVTRKVCIIHGGSLRVDYIDVQTMTLTSGNSDFAKCDVICSNGQFIFLNNQNEYNTIDGVTTADPDNWGRRGAVYGGYLIDCAGTIAAISNTQELTLNGSMVAGVQVAFDVYDSRRHRLVSLNASKYMDLDDMELVTSAEECVGALNPFYDARTDRIYGNNGSLGMLSFNPADFSETSMPYEKVLFAGTFLYNDDVEDEMAFVKAHFAVTPFSTPSNPGYVGFIDTARATDDSGDVFLFKVGNSGAGMLLSDVVTELHLMADETIPYDVSDLTDIVDGYAIARQTDVRAAIDSLRSVYYFDACESMGAIKFPKRGKDPVMTVDPGDLCAVEFGADGGEPLGVSRMLGDNLPRVVNVNYLLAATDYDKATKQARRVVGDGRAELTMDLPFVLSDTKGQEVANVNLDAAYAQRLSYTLNLPLSKYHRLEPADTIVVRNHVMRLDRIVDTPGGIRKCEAVSDAAAYYAPHVIVTETPPTTKVVYVPGETILFLM